jgi:hypothetical protein
MQSWPTPLVRDATKFCFWTTAAPLLPCAKPSTERLQCP